MTKSPPLSSFWSSTTTIHTTLEVEKALWHDKSHPHEAISVRYHDETHLT